MTGTRTLYRLVFKDGAHGAWTSDLARLEKMLDIFWSATIEARVFGRPE